MIRKTNLHEHFYLLSYNQLNFQLLRNSLLDVNMTTIVHFTTHARTVSVLILASFGIPAVEMRIVKWSIMSLFAPARMVTLDHLKLTAFSQRLVG